MLKKLLKITVVMVIFVFISGFWGCPFGQDPLADDAGTVIPIGFGAFKVIPNALFWDHPIGDHSCPDPMDPFSIEGPEGGRWEIDMNSIPTHITLPQSSGTFPGADIPMNFNCNISDYSSHEETNVLKILGFDRDDKPLEPLDLRLTVNIIAPEDQ